MIPNDEHGARVLLPDLDFDGFALAESYRIVDELLNRPFEESAIPMAPNRSAFR
jgi:hypothetical protein